MNLYLSHGRIWTGTMADAKEAQGGKDFVAVDFPTDKPGLLNTLNNMRTLFPGMFQVDGAPTEAVFPEQVVDAVPLYGHLPPAQRPEGYQNGDPTTIHLKSRNPAAVTSCRKCGRDERLANLSTFMAVRQDINSLSDVESLDDIIELAQARKEALAT